MAEAKYKLRYLPLFYEDLEQKVVYIAEKLKNPKAANDLIDAVKRPYWKEFLQQKPLNHINLRRRGDIHIIVSMSGTLLFGM